MACKNDCDWRSQKTSEAVIVCNTCGNMKTVTQIPDPSPLSNSEWREQLKILHSDTDCCQREVVEKFVEALCVSNVTHTIESERQRVREAVKGMRMKNNDDAEEHERGIPRGFNRALDSVLSLLEPKSDN